MKARLGGRSIMLAAVLGIATVAALPVRAQMIERAPTATKARAKHKSGQPKTEPKASAKRDAAEIRKKLDSAAAAIAANKTDVALRALDNVLSGGRIEAPLLARGLYLRGLAYRKQGKPAQAMADFSSALWVKGGLTGADRTTAQTAHSEAAREAGIAQTASPGPASERTAAARPEPLTPPRPRPARRPAPAQDSGSSGGGIGGFFNSLFGGGSSSTTAPVATATAPRAPRVGEPWSSTTEVRPKADLRAASRSHPHTTAHNPKAGYRLQVGTVRSRREAAALAARVRKSHPGAIGKHDAEIAETVLGNMGTFYQVKFGPFANAAEAGAACAKLKPSGVDCLVTTQ